VKHDPTVEDTTILPPSLITRVSGKFSDPLRTAKGELRASVGLEKLKTLWFNTGTLCNITCRGCYIESSPRNDALVYLTREEVRSFITEAEELHPDLEEIGFTGGEPFMNPAIVKMIADCLSAGYRTLVLSNAMKPMRRHEAALLDFHSHFGDRLAIRVSLDHFTAEGHEEVRGQGTWFPAVEGLRWLSKNRFNIAVAVRMGRSDHDAAMRSRFAAFFAQEGINVDAGNPNRLVLFPEMDEKADVPEITEACWGILGKTPADVMCSHSRMVVKRKHSSQPSVVACTLLPYDTQFDLGPSLRDASRSVSLNHPHCAKFCVLGGASCSA